MRRNWKLIRQILVTLESNADMTDITHEDTLAHVFMLNEEKYINLRGELTWKGHDLLEYLSDTGMLEELNCYELPATEEMFRLYHEIKLEKELFEEEDEFGE